MVNFAVEPASLADVDELLRLYAVVYGASYPLAFGADPAVMAATINHPDTLWLVARDRATGRVIASGLVDLDPVERLGKVEGLAVHPDHQGHGVMRVMLRQMIADVLGPGDRADSLYATTRTATRGPQALFLGEGFHPLGIFPNAHRVRQYETHGLVARFRDGVLDRRAPVRQLRAELTPLYTLTTELVGRPGEPPEQIPPVPLGTPAATDTGGSALEFVHAPHFVCRRFADTKPAFYPFHTPNLLISAVSGDYELYAHVNLASRYGALVGVPAGWTALAGELGGILEQLTDFGVTYVETLLPVDAHQELGALLTHGFLPCALYPAMRRTGEHFTDHVVMSRTSRPLDFRGLALHPAFRRHVKEYSAAWRAMHVVKLLEVAQ